MRCTAFINVRVDNKSPGNPWTINKSCFEYISMDEARVSFFISYVLSLDFNIFFFLYDYLNNEKQLLLLQKCQLKTRRKMR